MGRRWSALALATLAAAGVVVGAGGAVAAYWVQHHAPPEAAAAHDYTVRVVPRAPGAYHLLLPVPALADGQAAPGLALRILEGAPRVALAATLHGPALSLAGEGPVALAASGALPVRLTLDAGEGEVAQFKFWASLRAEAPVLVKVEVRQRAAAAGWDEAVATGRSIVVQDALRPEGWQVVRATMLFDVQTSGGYGEDFPRVVLGAVAVSAGGLYLPAGVLLARAVRRGPA